MNKVILMGRLTADPSTKYSQGEKPMAVTRYQLAVNRRFKREGEPEADFLACVTFGKAAEFAEKYFRKGLKIVISGRIRTGSYVDRDGIKRHTTDIVVEEQDFAESKAAAEQRNQTAPPPAGEDGFMNLSDGLEEELPFT